MCELTPCFGPLVLIGGLRRQGKAVNLAHVSRPAAFLNSLFDLTEEVDVELEAPAR